MLSRPFEACQSIVFAVRLSLLLNQLCVTALNSMAGAGAALIVPVVTLAAIALQGLAWTQNSYDPTD